MNRNAWNSHQWSSPKPSQIEIEPDRPLRQHHCSRCSRDFVESRSGERWAVYVTVFSFRRLPDYVSRQWLEEMCPGAPMPFDMEIRSRLIDRRAKKESALVLMKI
jgi:hypothetical protein